MHSLGSNCAGYINAGHLHPSGVWNGFGRGPCKRIEGGDRLLDRADQRREIVGGGYQAEAKQTVVSRRIVGGQIQR